MKNEKQLCENCKYFVQYYVANKNGTFSRLAGRGHCMNGDKIPAYKSKKHILKNSLCEFWESNEIRISERRESIAKTLCNMNKQLKEIACILKDDLSYEVGTNSFRHCKEQSDEAIQMIK